LPPPSQQQRQAHARQQQQAVAAQAQARARAHAQAQAQARARAQAQAQAQGAQPRATAPSATQQPRSVPAVGPGSNVQTSTAAVPSNTRRDESDLGFDPWAEMTRGLALDVERESHEPFGSDWKAELVVAPQGQPRSRSRFAFAHAEDASASSAPQQTGAPPATQDPRKGAPDQWQEQMRILFPGVNISFGGGGPADGSADGKTAPMGGPGNARGPGVSTAGQYSSQHPSNLLSPLPPFGVPQGAGVLPPNMDMNFLQRPMGEVRPNDAGSQIPPIPGFENMHLTSDFTHMQHFKEAPHGRAGATTRS